MSPAFDRLPEHSLVMTVVSNCELQSLDLALAHLNFPGEEEPVELRAVEQETEPHHALPFELLLLAVLEPFCEYSGYRSSFLRPELAFKRVQGPFKILALLLLDCRFLF